MSKIPKRKYPITTDNVNNLGGKELILKRMVNHYAALTNIKPRIDTSKPFEFNKDRLFSISEGSSELKKEQLTRVKELKIICVC